MSKTALHFIKESIITQVVLTFLLSLLLLLPFLQFPKTQNFDEFHYVPSAKQFIQLIENQNWEHPPLGKELMAIGIATLGDRPVGWRIMNVLFGAALLSCLFLLALEFFGSKQAAWFVFFISLFNHFCYVQSRIGMLDGFMVFFLFLGALLLLKEQKSEIKSFFSLQLFLAFLFFGFSIACKWAAIPPVFFFVVVFLATQKTPKKTVLQLTTFGLFALLLGYYLPFIPYLFIDRIPAYSFSDILFNMQIRMWEGQQRVVTAHNYMSHWSTWPLAIRPIWYAFDREPPDFVRGVFLVGNPLIMGFGLFSVFFCFWEWIKQGTSRLFCSWFFYVSFYLSWALIPRKISFYYYYYPCALLLSFSIFSCLDQLLTEKRKKWGLLLFAAFTFALFCTFFPIMAALRIKANSFIQYMWLRSWI